MTLPRSYAPFAVYETFAPTTLRGKVVMVAATDAVWRADLPATLAMECARLGAHLVLAAPNPAVYQPVSRDITSYGRPVLELVIDAPEDGRSDAAMEAAAAVLARFPRIDLLVTIGASGLPALALGMVGVMEAVGGGCIVAVAPPEAAAALQQQVAELHQRFHPRGIRANGIIAAAAFGEAAGPSPQEIAWQMIFLASPAGATISGHCLAPTAAPEPAH